MAKKVSPTLFVFQGSPLVYDGGSMLELHSQITAEEWELIISETIKYKAFVECIKEIMIPKLEDEWAKEDELFLKNLEVAVSRMRNIDPLLVAKYNYDEIKKSYQELVTKGSQGVAKELQKTMAEYKEQVRKTVLDNLDIQVSDI